ncbi:MAG: iron transporter substrate-binding protein [Betaproteobacteria bacterium]|nr:iron transporter substrate-binding protein [Betaproteobacteria bacterium]
MHFRIASIVGAVLLLPGLLSGINDAGAATPSTEGIVVYNAQHVSLTKAWVEGFTHDTGIKVTVRNGGDSALANQLVQEGTASPADVFLTENSPAMTLVDNAGLFAPVDPATLAEVPAAYRPAHGKWTGIAARATVFVYNKSKLPPAELPKSLTDLANPGWKGRWAASPAGSDFQAVVSALLELKGEAATSAWLKAMKENATAYRGNGAVLQAVNAGQIDGGVIYHYYYYADQAKTGENSKNLALHYFKRQDPGAFVSISGGGVLASSKHKEEAQAFLKWVVGKAGQEVLRTGEAYEYAVGSGVESSPKLVPLGELDAPKVETAKLNGKKVIELMTQAGLL